MRNFINSIGYGDCISGLDVGGTFPRITKRIVSQSRADIIPRVIHRNILDGNASVLEGNGIREVVDECIVLGAYDIVLIENDGCHFIN